MPARLHVVMRPETKLAVVVRTSSQGGKKVSCTIGWDRRDDSFRMGQWIGGRLYPHECDISPDGAWFSYNALNGKFKDPVTLGVYAALSRAPFLKAEKLFPVGNRWMVGSLIFDRSRGRHKRDTPCPPMPDCFGLTSGTYHSRLRRDGWRTRERKVELGPHHMVTSYARPLVGVARLVKHFHFDGNIGPQKRPVYYETHSILDTAGTRHPQDDWEWAEVDGPDLVWMEAGILYRADIGVRGLPQRPRVLRDFNGMRFQRLLAPY
jgi:hypothetical protein